MSSAQHMGDLIFPCPLGHWEMSTVPPSSKVRVSWTRSAPHSPQVMLTLIPQLLQVYAAMVVYSVGLGLIKG